MKVHPALFAKKADVFARDNMRKKRVFKAELVKKSGKTYTITVENNVEYAPYVEYGHRTRGGKGFVPGKRMLETSEQELKALSPKILQDKLEKFLNGVFSG